MADTVLTDLKIHDFDSLAQMSQYESEIGENDIAFTPDLSCRLPLLTPMWFDHIANDISWLRADTFSWQSGDVYVAAYEHLANDSVKLYAWASGAAIYYTLTETPAVGDNVYSSNEHDDPSQIESVDNGTITFDDPRSGVQKVATRDATGDSNSFVLGIGLKTDTIGDVTITYYLAQDGHKICTPDQESNLVALYEATGVAWYYILDTENKQFKLPRTKWGFTGLRDEVGGYVPAGLPNITGRLRVHQNQIDTPSGAFDIETGTTYTHSASVATGTETVAFSAQSSNSIYGNSDTVQPKSTQMYLYFYVGNFERDAVEQTAGITVETLNGKADSDLGNIPANYDYVVESQLPTSNNNYTWYRKYKSGWLEMGGKLTGRSVTFPVAFALPPTLTMSTGSTDAAATNQNTYSTLTTTGFTGWQTGTNAGWHSGATNFNGYWHACGTAEQ